MAILQSGYDSYKTYKKLANPALGPARGSYEDGFDEVARCFARQLADGDQIGASFAIYWRGRCVVDLWGGMAELERWRVWERDTRVVVFSVTKGFAAMAFHLLADRGLLDWGAPVSQYWPGFGRAGKEDMDVATLLGHRGGLAYLDQTLQMADCVEPARREALVEVLEAQRPGWEPGQDQGYHAVTFGMYATELFERIAGESMGEYLRRELFEPLGSDVMLGTPAAEDHRCAALYPPKASTRVKKMLSSALTRPSSAEARVFKEFLDSKSVMKRAFMNPHVPRNDIRLYNSLPVRRAQLAWASATASAQGVARAYLPFASGGVAMGRRFFNERTLEPAYRRLGWSDRDLVLQKPLGWSHGFLKEEAHLFCPNEASFGHAGMGGSLGWADPVEQIALGYAMNKMDWRVRSKRAVELCQALYRCEALLNS
jgi:CubicO group peptidase (beta-lactamase class C family)